MRKHGKRIAGILLALLMTVGSVLPVAAETYKTGDSVVVVHDGVWAFHGGRQDNEVTGGSTANGGNRGNHYNNRLYWYDGNSIDILTMSGSRYTPQYDGKVYLYCIQYGKHYVDGDRTVEVAKNGNITGSAYWRSLGWSRQTLLKCASIYGFPAQTPQQLGVSAVDDAYAATQVVLWEITQGYTYATRGQSDVYRHYILYAYTGNGHTAGERTPAATAYDRIWAGIAQHDKLASFNGQTVTLRWNGTAYVGSVTDSNGVLSGSHPDTAPSGLTVQKNGNTVTFSTTQPIRGTAEVRFKKNLSEQLERQAPFAVLGSGAGGQEMLCGTLGDPKDFYVYPRTADGVLRLRKTAEDGSVAGIRFRITGNRIDRTVTTAADGTIDLTLPAGTYTVTEADPPDRYTKPASQTVTVSDGQTAAVQFENVLKKWWLTVTKRDAETGTAQGDATLAGAVYGIYLDGALQDRYITDKNGQFTTKEYPCGSGWTLQEIAAAPGYQLSDTVYPVGAEPGQLTAEHNALTQTVTEQVIAGRIGITKHTDDGSTQRETPEVGAEFEVFRTESGSFAAAKESERDRLVIGQDGYAQTKLLPYGTYTVHQTKSWDGRYPVDDFTVQVDEHGKTYRYVLNNAAFYAHVRIVKTDAESGRVIPYAGAAFRLYRPDGSPVTFEQTYPTHEIIDTFTTTADGTLLTPEKLIYGIGYTLVEIKAPTGYVLDSTPVVFDITEENSTAEGALTVVRVTRADVAQKASLSVTKSGEVFASVREQDGVYAPVFETRQLAGAEYDLVAAEDIRTPDGTLRAAAETVIATLTTDADAPVTVTGLYLGKYRLIEKKAPAGCVRDPEPTEIELTYGGQAMAVTQHTAALENARQKAEVCLRKTLETDKRYTLGERFAAVRFGLYAAEELTAADGSKIPANGLLGVTGIDADGIGRFAADLPYGRYVVREIAAAPGYVPDGTAYPIEFLPGADDVALVELTVNDGQPLVNRLQRGGLRIVKTFEGQEMPVPGVRFLIECTELGFAQRFATDENGEILLEDLLPGIYTVTEETGGWLAGYLPAERCTVTVEADKTAVLPIVNRRAPQTGDVPSPIPAALMLFGAGAFAVTARRKKRG